MMRLPPRSTLFPCSSLFRSGLGRLIISAVLRRDYPVIQGVVLCIAGVSMLVNLAVDLSYLVIDPQVRKKSEEHTSELQSRPHPLCRLLLEITRTSRGDR